MDESFAREICHAETDLTTKVQQQERRDIIAINRDISLNHRLVAINSNK